MIEKIALNNSARNAIPATLARFIGRFDALA